MISQPMKRFAIPAVLLAASAFSACQASDPAAPPMVTPRLTLSRSKVPLGAPIYLSKADRSEVDGLWVAQDTGGAIKGPNRFDTFWGAGAEAVAIAGGLTQQARHSQVVLFRRISAYVAESHVIDLKKMLDSHDLREDLHLQPGDFIFVPQSRISKIRKYVPTNSMSWYMNPLQF